jgi:hypothetical protein
VQSLQHADLYGAKTSAPCKDKCRLVIVCHDVSPVMNQLDLLLSLLAFALGFCLSRVSLCAVAAAKSLVLQRHGAAMAALAVAASASGVALLVLNRLWPMQVVLPLDMRVSDRMIIGGILLGAGALINGGCYLGSVSYLGTGNVNFLFTLLGIGLSTRWIGPAAAPMSGMGHALHWLPATIALAAFWQSSAAQ